MDVKLREVIWEITPKCNKNCDYCGSKNILKKKPLGSPELRNIANDLLTYGVEEVTLSGGEPSTLDDQILKEIVKILRRNEQMKVKIVTNGFLFSKNSVFVDSFDVIGLSINTSQEILEISARLSCITPVKKKTTIITNFGNHNVFEFDEILGFIQTKGFNCWQVQLTQGANQLNKEGIKYLYEKLDSADCEKELSIVVADNLQKQHSCTAGIMSSGISYEGEVVGCISERAWNGGEFVKAYGRLVGKTGRKSLKEIWENEFKDIRFHGCRKSCRDCVGYPEEQEKSKEQPIINVFYAVSSPPIGPQKLPQFPHNQVFLYGVNQPPQVVVYGAFDKISEINKGDE